MDEIQDANFRETAATLIAHRFLIEMLWSYVLQTQGNDPQKVIDAVLLASRRSDHIRASDEASAEMLSDIAVRSQQLVAEMLDRARGGRAG